MSEQRAGRRMGFGVGVAAFVGVAGSVSPAVAQGGGAGGDGEPIASVYFGGWERVFDHPKDAVLAEAFALSEARLAELPGELRAVMGDGGPEQFAIIDEVVRFAQLVGGSELASSFRLDVSGPEPFPAWSMTLWPDGGEAEASELEAMLQELARQGGVVFEEVGGRGIEFVDVDGVRAGLGVVESSGRSAVHMGAGSLAGEVHERWGGEPIFAGLIDLGAIEWVPEMYGGDEKVAEALEYLGVKGADAIELVFSVGREDSGRLLAEGRMVDGAGLLERFGIRRAVSLDRDSLRVVPRDATSVYAWAYDFGGVRSVVERMLTAMDLDEDVMGSQGYRTGMGIVDGLMSALGDEVVVYQSLTTGGGGIGSTIVSFEVEDETSLAGWLDRMSGLANGAGAQFARGYVMIDSHEGMEGVRMWSARTTGLPLPLDVTSAVGDGRWTLGLTETSVREALGHVRGGGPSVLDNREFGRSMAGEFARGGVVGVSWRDLGRASEDSYVIAELVGVAAQNAVRQRFAGPREPGVEALSYGEFVRDVEPAAGIVFFDGDDLVSRGWSDGSVLVNLSVGIQDSWRGQWVTVVPALTGALIPAVSEARSAAEQASAAQTMRQVMIVNYMYAAANDDRFASSFDELMPFLDGRSVASPYAVGGDSGIAIRGDLGLISDIEFPSRMIVAVDRAMLDDRSVDTVAVAFADGSARVLSKSEFDRMIEDEVNGGGREAFGL